MFDAAGYYDVLGDLEWDRLDATVAGRVSFQLHRRLLAEYVRPGWRVLEVGAGPGRFTRVLAELGATVVVSDISPVQRRLNADHLTGTPAEAAVEARVLLDVADTSRNSPVSSTPWSPTAALCPTCSTARRPYRHRVPVRRWTPTCRLAAELSAPARSAEGTTPAWPSPDPGQAASVDVPHRPWAAPDSVRCCNYPWKPPGLIWPRLVLLWCPVRGL